VPNGELRLWADAICINQADVDERGQQVGMMFRIYQLASRVHIWLGEAEPQAIGGIYLLERIFGKTKTLNRAPSDIDLWSTEEQRTFGIEALASLCRAPYWTRMWIVQEVSHKGHNDMRNVLHLGDKSLRLPSWMDIPSPNRWLEQGQEERKNRSDITPAELAHLRKLDRAVSEIEAAFYPMVIATWGFMTNEILASGDIAFARFIPTLVAELRKAHATDPKDKIYGMLGLLSGAMSLTPDYRKSTRQVYCEATVEIMKVTRTLFIIHQACPLDKGLPSWVPDYENSSPMPASFQKNFETFRADAVTLLLFEQIDEDTLSLHGLIADRVHYISHTPLLDETDRAGCFSALRAWRTFFEEHFLHATRARCTAHYETFWRTACIQLKAINVSTNINFEAQDTEAFETLCQTARTEDYLTGRDQIELERFYHVVREHDMFITEAGCLGLVARERARRGDYVLVLSSAYCPFVARGVQRRGEKAYTLI